MVALKRQCDCVKPSSHVWDVHPGHIVNMWDVQRLANMLIASPPNRSDLEQAGVTTVTLGEGGFKACCCDQPPEDVGVGAVAYWARVCRPRQ